MGQNNVKKIENLSVEVRVDNAIERNSKFEILSIIRESERAGMYVLSREDYSKKISEPLTKRTLAHECVRLRTACALRAMSLPKIWLISDSDGWSVGHEAVKHHQEVARKCIESRTPSLLKITNNRGESIGKTIYLANRLSLSREDVEYLKQHVNIGDNFKTGNGNNNGNKSGNVSTTLHTDKPDLISAARNSNSQPKTTQVIVDTKKTIQVTEEELITKEILSSIMKLAQEGKQKEIIKLLHDDNILTHYITNHKIALDLELDSKGNKIAHYLAASNEKYALELISDPEIARLTNKNGWSVAHEAVGHYLEVAKHAMNSISTENNIWEIRNESGITVGHVAVRNHLNIALATISSQNFEKLLKLDDDHEDTIAHVGVKWSEFAILALNDLNIYNMTNANGITVAMEAIKLHNSSARKILSNTNKYLSELGIIDGSKLIELAKKKLAEQSK